MSPNSVEARTAVVQLKIGSLVWFSVISTASLAVILTEEADLVFQYNLFLLSMILNADFQII